MLSCYDSGVRTLREPAPGQHLLWSSSGMPWLIYSCPMTRLRQPYLLRHFCPTSPARDLYPFHLLPQLSERNILSYAFASGMLAEACPL
jgi:hypothetical protein